VYSQITSRKIKAPAGQRKLINVSEFKEIFNLLNLIHRENFTFDDISKAFNESMSTIVEDVTSDRVNHINMAEFIEALARAASKLSEVHFEDQIAVLFIKSVKRYV
jgi:hypothetical protein